MGVTSQLIGLTIPWIHLSSCTLTESFSSSFVAHVDISSMRSSVGSSSLRRVRPSWIRNTNHVVASINGCTQKRIVYNGKSQTKMDDLRVPPFWEPLCENGSSKGQDFVSSTAWGLGHPTAYWKPRGPWSPVTVLLRRGAGGLFLQCSYTSIHRPVKYWPSQSWSLVTP